jgi:hypothetical protein
LSAVHPTVASSTQVRNKRPVIHRRRPARDRWPTATDLAVVSAH